MAPVLYSLNLEPLQGYCPQTHSSSLTYYATMHSLSWEGKKRVTRHNFLHFPMFSQPLICADSIVQRDQYIFRRYSGSSNISLLSYPCHCSERTVLQPQVIIKITLSSTLCDCHFLGLMAIQGSYDKHTLGVSILRTHVTTKAPLSFRPVMFRAIIPVVFFFFK